MNRFIVIAPLLMLAACGNQYDSKRPTAAAIYYHDNPASSISLSSSAAASSSAVKHSVVLVDQSFEGAALAKGMARLKAMKTVRIKGDIHNSSITFTLSRNGQNEGVSGVFAYAAKLNEKGQIIPETEWIHFRAVGAEWQGLCRRVLGPNSDFLSGKGETVERDYKLLDLPVSVGDEGCATGTMAIDLESKINDNGIALGFFPSNTGYHLKAVLNYEGTVEITHL